MFNVVPNITFSQSLICCSFSFVVVGIECGRALRTFRYVHIRVHCTTYVYTNLVQQTKKVGLPPPLFPPSSSHFRNVLLSPPSLSLHPSWDDVFAAIRPWDEVCVRACVSVSMCACSYVLQYVGTVRIMCKTRKMAIDEQEIQRTPYHKSMFSSSCPLWSAYGPQWKFTKATESRIMQRGGGGGVVPDTI